jgi:phenylpropionate dioxygenase-like ring-hydroxylating dioxygenase large terminal subunit
MITSIPMHAPWGIGLSKNLKHNRVKSVTIEGKKYTMFRNDAGKVSLIDSVCPHRGADLSMGKLTKDGCVQCPYHGWEFDASGRLTKVPSIKDGYSVPTKGSVKGYTVVESGGFIWLTEPEQQLPTKLCDELFDATWTRVYGSKVLEGNIIDWIMNGVDISHINYVHDFANEDNGKVDNVVIKPHYATCDIESCDLDAINMNYVDCHANVKPKASSSFTEHMQPENGSEIHSRFIAPNTTAIRIKLKDPYEFITFTTLLPVDDTHTKMSWCLLYPKSFIMDLPFVFDRFYHEMYKTVAQDETIIKGLSPVEFPYIVNVPCDMFQMEALKMIGLK